MECQTSEQAYREYQRLKVVEDKLRKENRGLNLINSQESKPTFSIRFFKQVVGNLLTTKSKILVNSNLPFMNWNFQDVSIDEFFEKFEEYIKLPIFKRFIKLNRRQDNQLREWGLPKFQENIIDINDIDISFGEECLREMESKDKNFAVNLRNRISSVLFKQKIADESQEKDFTRYFLLLERIDDLKRQIKSPSYRYSYREEETLKITITDEEYNKKLKEIEDEMTALNKKYSFLELPRFDYREEEESDPHEYEDDEDYDEDYEECED